MKTATSATSALVAILALGSFSLACSAPSRGASDVDTGTALSALRSPTGSFSKATGASAFAGYRTQRADSAKVSAPGAGSTSTTSSTGTRSIRLLNQAASSGACGQGEACACPNGGTMSFTGESSAEGQLVRVTFDACGFEDGYGFDGKAILLTSNTSLLGIAAEPAAAPSSGSSSSGAPSSGASSSGAPSSGLQQAPATSSPTAAEPVSVLLAAKGTMSDGTTKQPLEFALVTEAHYAFLAVSVPDGNLVIGLSDSGDAIVRSKEGTWKCNNGGGASAWTCTSESGETIDVAEDASGSAAPPASSGAPSAPPASSGVPSAP